MDSCSDDDGIILFKNCGNCTLAPLNLSANKSYGERMRLPIGTDYTIKDVTDRISSNYNWIMSLADKRVSDWPLMGSPAPTIVITIAYILICCKGDRYLRLEDNRGRHRGIGNLIMRFVLVAYNTLLIILNAYIMIRLWEPCTIYQIQCHPGIYNEQASSCSCNAREIIADIGLAT